MRLFVAFEIPEPVRREVRRRMAGPRERLPRARWVDPDVLHLTLLFLGEVAPERVAALAGRLGLAFAAHPALPLRLAQEEQGQVQDVGVDPARPRQALARAPPAPLDAAASRRRRSMSSAIWLACQRMRSRPPGSRSRR